MTVEFVGLGAMGWPMAARLAQAGHVVRGLDADPAVQARWRERFGDTPGAAGAVLVCVSDEDASRAVLRELLGRCAPGTLVVDHTTTSAAWAREADGAARAAGLRWCDAPLSGGTQGAQQGQLVAMLGAHPGDVDAVRALLRPVAATVLHLGAPGSGQLCKMANQLAIAGVAAGLAQVQAFARTAGLDAAQVYEVLLSGTARSVQLERLHTELGAGGRDAAQVFGWLRKDLALCEQAAGPLPLVRLWERLWEERPA